MTMTNDEMITRLESVVVDVQEHWVMLERISNPPQEMYFVLSRVVQAIDEATTMLKGLEE
jgi:hypothetical protein